MQFLSMTYGVLDLEDIPERLKSFYDERKVYGAPFNLIVGTDSQNHSETKVVSVVAIVCEGHGGIFFYTQKKVPLVNSIREKLEKETGESLKIAMELLESLEMPFYREFMENVPLSIHIDAGTTSRSKTASLVDGLIGWVKAVGLNCEVKPDSFVASSIADRISK